MKLFRISLELDRAARRADDTIHCWVKDDKILADAELQLPCCEILPRLLGVPSTGMIQRYDNFTDDHIPVLEALAGPHGWTIYKMLEARNAIKVKPSEA